MLQPELQPHNHYHTIFYFGHIKRIPNKVLPIFVYKFELIKSKNNSTYLIIKGHRMETKLF